MVELTELQNRFPYFDSSLLLKEIIPPSYTLCIVADATWKPELRLSYQK